MAASQRPGPIEGDDGTYVDPVLGKRFATPARMRARALEVPQLESVAEREDYISMLMLHQVWTPHTSRECQLVCAEAWGVVAATVRDYSSGASRILHARARDEGGMFANIALRSMSTVAELGCTSDLPGDKSAAVQASKELLKFAGLAEPEEDKNKPATVVVVGQIATSPAMKSLFGAKPVIEANGVTNHSGTNGTHEGAGSVPAELPRGQLVSPKNGKSSR